MSFSKVRFLKRDDGSFRSSCQVTKLKNVEENITKNEAADALEEEVLRKRKC